MPDIFVSHSHEDHAYVELLVGKLREQGWDLWWSADLTPGPSFDREIETAIDQSSCVLVVWSAHAVASDWVRTEAHEGLDRNILVPISIDQAKIPLAFRRHQTLSLEPWFANGADTNDPLFGRLLESIRRLITPAREAIDPERKFRAEQLLELGRSRLDNLRSTEALDLFSAAILQNPDLSEAYAERASARLRERRLGGPGVISAAALEAIRGDIQAALDRAPDNRTARHLQHVMQFYFGHAYQSGLDDACEMLTGSPVDTGFMRLADMLVTLGDFDRAIQILSLIRRPGRGFPAHSLTARMHAKRGRYDAARNAVDRARSANEPGAQLALTDIALFERDLDALARLVPEPTGRFRLGYALFLCRRYYVEANLEAAERYRTAITLSTLELNHSLLAELDWLFGGRKEFVHLWRVAATENPIQSLAEIRTNYGFLLSGEDGSSRPEYAGLLRELGLDDRSVAGLDLRSVDDVIARFS